MTTFAAQNLLCRRGGRRVFQGLSFALEGGQALILRGANGSGKSSLLRVLAGLIDFADGHLTWDGVALEEDPDAHRKRLHYLGHADPIKPVFSVTENLMFWARLGEDGGEEARIDAALDMFDLVHLRDLPARFLSAGQRRRLNLARLLAADRPLWLLDEPTTALDAASSARVAHAIEGHVAAGGMVIASTHLEMGLTSASTLMLDDFTVPHGADDAAALDFELEL